MNTARNGENVPSALGAMSHISAADAVSGAAQTPLPDTPPSVLLLVSDETHTKLQALAEESGESVSDILAIAVEQLRRKRMFEQSNAAYAAMRNDPVAWQEELAERRLWNVTLADG